VNLKKKIEERELAAGGPNDLYDISFFDPNMSRSPVALFNSSLGSTVSSEQTSPRLEMISPKS